MNEEWFDVVDEQDRVREQLPRSEVHARHLLHRAVHIFVWNGRGELLIHKRSASKDEWPLLWTSSASGHVSAGEEYDPSAVRELEEELGLNSPLDFLQKFAACDDLAREHTCLYETQTDRLPQLDPGEIAEAKFLLPREISGWMDRSPEEFTPAFRLLFQWYCKREK